MKKVNTIADLKTERTRLKLTVASLENEIEKDIEDIKTMLAPLNMVKKGVSQIVHKPEDKDLLSATGGKLIEMLMKYVLLRKSGFVKRFLLSKAASNILTNILHKNKDTIHGKISRLISNFMNGNKGVNAR